MHAIQDVPQPTFSLPLKPHPKADILLPPLAHPPVPSPASFAFCCSSFVHEPERYTATPALVNLVAFCSGVSRTSGILSKYGLDCSGALCHPSLVAGSTVLWTADALDLVRSLAYERALESTSFTYSSNAICIY